MRSANGLDARCAVFLRDESGLETVEYAVITVLIVIGIVAATASLGSAIGSRLTAAADIISG